MKPLIYKSLLAISLTILSSCGSSALDPLGLCDTPQTSSSQSEFNFSGSVNQALPSQTSDVNLICSNDAVYIGSSIDNASIAAAFATIDSKVLIKMRVTPTTQAVAGTYRTTARLKLFADQTGNKLLKEITWPVTVTIR
jgi:hypothetical protein